MSFFTPYRRLIIRSLLVSPLGFYRMGFKGMAGEEPWSPETRKAARATPSCVSIRCLFLVFKFDKPVFAERFVSACGTFLGAGLHVNEELTRR